MWLTFLLRSFDFDSDRANQPVSTSQHIPFFDVHTIIIKSIFLTLLLIQYIPSIKFLFYWGVKAM